MSKYLFRVIILVLISFPMLNFAQESDRTIASAIQSQLEKLKQDAPSNADAGLIWAYARFNEVPSPSQEDRMRAYNIQRYQYEPDLKWFISFPEDINVSQLQDAGITSLWDRPLHRTIDTRVLTGQLPDYVMHANGVEAIITTAATTELSRFKDQLTALGLQINGGFDPLGIIGVAGESSALIEVAKLPFVIYIELPEPPAELEIEDEMTMTRAPFINGYYNLNGVNGAEVTIAVNEGGIVDTLYDPDFKNRIDRSLEGGNVSGHKTGVSWRMASAGNINPIHRGQAWGAELMSGGINFNTAALNDVNIVNNSFGYGCIPAAGPNYNAGAALNDYLVYNHTRFMITYSCGNIGGSSCASYGAGAPWGSITGLVKSAKNIFAVGAMNTNDQLTGFSSIGPAMDGRILPDITATGPGGTSHASPNLAGVNAILTESYRNENTNTWPNSGLIKGIILNTADDINNPGPDFETGFGRINAQRANEVIVGGQFASSSIANNEINTHSINVPSGVKQLKVSLYWTDRESTAGNYGKTLVNDLDLRLQDPSSTWHQPWVLNTFPHPDSLDLPAVPGTDTLNNVELITIDDPSAGTYTAEVTGSLVPLGSELYHVIYSFVYDSITVVFPYGGEGLVPNETRRIRWDASAGSNSFSIDFSSDSGATWQSVATNISSTLRTYTWQVPNNISGKCLIRVSDGSQTTTSAEPFTISEVPNNLHVVWRCADSAIFAWDSIPGVLGYRVYRLGNEFMDTAGFTTDPLFKIHNLSNTETEWVTVQAVLPDSGSSRRAIALAIAPGDLNCIGIDLALTEVLSPSATFFPSCFIGDSLNLTMKLQNTGTTNLNTLPIGFQVNSAPIQHDTLFTSLASAYSTIFTDSSSVVLQSGTNTLKVWCAYPGDSNALNDTIVLTLTNYSSSSASLPYTQNFDNFTSCSTAWGCESITCALSQGWINLANANGSDSIDWRTHSGTTGSGGTGPSGDHTSGTGNYLYLEGSGNGGSGCQWKEAQLHSPCFDLSDANDPMISYWYHAYGSAIGSLHMDVLADGQWYLDVSDPVLGQQGNQWLQREASLAAFEGQEIMIRFRGITGGGWLSDLAIDDINITTKPKADFSVAYDTFCLGQTVPLINETSYANSYTWSILPNTYTLSSGNLNSASPIIEPSDTGWYDVQLIANNAIGADTLLITDFFYVGVFDAPSLTSDPPYNSICFDDSITFTASGAGSTYDFYLNGSLMQSGASDTWTALSINSGDLVWVENFINPNCSDESAGIEVTVQPNLNNSLLWTDEPDLQICTGDTVQFLAQNGLSNYSYMVSGSAAQNGTDSSFITDALIDGDEVYVLLTDSIGCTGVTDTLTWTVYPNPVTPQVIDIGNDSLEASVVADAYQWWLAAQLLADSTRQIKALSSGNYSVRIWEGECSSDLSNPYMYTLLNVFDLEKHGIKVFPNPTSGTLFIQNDAGSRFALKLYDAAGKLVLDNALESGLNALSLETMAKGIYSIHLIDVEDVFISKIIVK